MDLNFLDKNSQRTLLSQEYQIIHIGLVLIGIHGLHKQNYGSKVLTALVDNSDSAPQKAISVQWK